jgi:hypothetical protein
MMAPTIIFDKSVLQSLTPQEIQDVSRYFYTVIPPILLLEMLGDLSLDPDHQPEREDWVAKLARKVPLTNSGAIPDFRKLCFSSLIGVPVPVDYRGPVADAADMVVTEDGAQAIVHPEKTAVLRWCKGQFNDADHDSAALSRQRAQATDFESIKRALPKLQCRVRTLGELQTFVDRSLTEPEFQSPLLQWFLSVLGYDQQTNSRVFAGWERANVTRLREFAPYATHCLRVHLLFYLGVGLHQLSTRRSNVIDIEYLCYAPFANVFCSDDKFLKKLGSLVIESDQSFENGERMHKCLNEIATARKTNNSAMPDNDSIIAELWQKHCKCSPRLVVGRHPTEEESKRLTDAAKAIFDALRQERQKRGPPPRFPM